MPDSEEPAMTPEPVRPRGSDYAMLTRQVKQAGLLNRRLRYYIWKIVLTAAALALGWVAFAAIGDLVSYIIYADPDSVPPDMSLLLGQVHGNDRLNDGQWLANDGYLVSDDGRYAAYLQDDGNFVLVHADNGAPNLGQPYWSVFGNATNKIVGKYSGGPCFVTMQSDGNLVLYNGRSPVSPGSPYWATSGTAQPELGTFAAVMQNDANFVVYKRDPKSSKLGGVLFATGTDYISRQ